MAGEVRSSPVGWSVGKLSAPLSRVAAATPWSDCQSCCCRWCATWVSASGRTSQDWCKAGGVVRSGSAAAMDAIAGMLGFHIDMAHVDGDAPVGGLRMSPCVTTAFLLRLCARWLFRPVQRTRWQGPYCPAMAGKEVSRRMAWPTCIGHCVCVCTGLPGRVACVDVGRPWATHADACIGCRPRNRRWRGRRLSVRCAVVAFEARV